ncbi:secretion-regulating guanine nucleotide exchange factor isoform X5 [Chrysemys picta bellii]|uniref:secretion-regulating guanine nucleotide exchange factor isoform X5 n=1 Tax=Chrysemys picta bellii TaxID=8478 RepID=UPI0032B18F15
MEAARTLFAWGANSYGQLGLGHKEDVLLPQSLNDFSCKHQNIKSIAGGGGHSAVITGAGELFVCGQNKERQLGLNHTEDVLCFTSCTALSSVCVIQVACGWDFTIILTGNGQVLSCGSNSFGQLGVPQTSGGCLIPQKIESLTEKAVNVAAGLRHALAATESGVVFQWGTGMASRANRASQGKIIPSFLTAKEPCKVTGLEDVKVKKVTASSYHSVSLTDEGELCVWGSNKHGQLVSKETFLVEPQKIDAHFFSGEKIGAVWSGWTHVVAQTAAANSSSLPPPSRRLSQIRRRKKKTQDEMFSEIMESSRSDRAHLNEWKETVSKYRKEASEREDRRDQREDMRDQREERRDARDERWRQEDQRRQDATLGLLREQTDMLRRLVELQE